MKTLVKFKHATALKSLKLSTKKNKSLTNPPTREEILHKSYFISSLQREPTLRQIEEEKDKE